MRATLRMPGLVCRLSGGGDQCFSELPKFFIGRFLTSVFRNPEQPRQNSHHIAVEDRFGFVKSDARNRAGGVRADSWQLQNGFMLPRKLSGMVCHNLPRSFLHVPDTSVVTQAFPEFVD